MRQVSLESTGTELVPEKPSRLDSVKTLVIVMAVALAMMGGAFALHATKGGDSAAADTTVTTSGTSTPQSKCIHNLSYMLQSFTNAMSTGHLPVETVRYEFASLGEAELARLMPEVKTLYSQWVGDNMKIGYSYAIDQGSSEVARYCSKGN